MFLSFKFIDKIFLENFKIVLEYYLGFLVVRKIVIIRLRDKVYLVFFYLIKELFYRIFKLLLKKVLFSFR